MLTTRQQEVLDFIVAFIRRYRSSPSVRQIGAAFGISSPNGVACHLKALEKKGFIKRDPDWPRAIRLANRGNHCPLCGRETE